MKQMGQGIDRLIRRSRQEIECALRGKTREELVELICQLATLERLLTARQIASVCRINTRHVGREMTDGRFVDPLYGPGFYMFGSKSKKVSVSAAEAWREKLMRRAAAISFHASGASNKRPVEAQPIGQRYVRLLKNRQCVKLQLEPPSYELLRLRDVRKWLGITRDYVELLEKEGMITPFRKRKGAKAWYFTRQFCRVFQVPLPDLRKAPPIRLLRRFDVLNWLGVPAAELESWVRYRIISPTRCHRKQRKAYYSMSKIKENVLFAAQ
jgi:hypothetical protein